MNRLDRFMEKTHRDSETGCLMWSGTVHSTGYGHFWDGSKLVHAHRWIFIEKNGYAPEVVRHRCDTPLCVDWESCLIPGTQDDNIQDSIKRGRMPGTGDDCRNGHRDRWSTQVNYRNGRVNRRCKECARVWAAERRRRDEST
jgi:hypothetical protein